MKIEPLHSEELGALAFICCLGREEAGPAYRTSAWHFSKQSPFPSFPRRGIVPRGETVDV
jgi:hypothetical protein